MSKYWQERQIEQRDKAYKKSQKEFDKQLAKYYKTTIKDLEISKVVIFSEYHFQYYIIYS